METHEGIRELVLAGRGNAFLVKLVENL
jgi:hypothetical protein